jgi:hypothetical protein
VFWVVWQFEDSVSLLYLNRCQSRQRGSPESHGKVLILYVHTSVAITGCVSVMAALPVHLGSQNLSVSRESVKARRINAERRCRHSPGLIDLPSREKIGGSSSTPGIDTVSRPTQ